MNLPEIGSKWVCTEFRTQDGKVSSFEGSPGPRFSRMFIKEASAAKLVIGDLINPPSVSQMVYGWELINGRLLMMKNMVYTEFYFIPMES